MYIDSFKLISFEESTLYIAAILRQSFIKILVVHRPQPFVLQPLVIYQATFWKGGFAVDILLLTVYYEIETWNKNHLVVQAINHKNCV